MTNIAKPPKALALAITEDRLSASISIRGDIGDWWEGRDLDQVEREIDWLPSSVKNLTIRITSRGGDLPQGLAIHNALQRVAAHKVAIIEGVAASAATLIAMAADEIHIQANAAIMIHGVHFEDEDGNPVEVPEAERAMNETMLETYAAKTGKSRDELLKVIAQDTWMTAREAVAAGFADTLIELASPRAQAAAFVALASASGIPSDVIERAQAQAAEQGGDDPAPAPEPADPHASEGGDPQPEPVPAGPNPKVSAEATFAAKVNALAVAHGLGDYVGAWLLDGGITTAAQAEAAIAEAREVRDLCIFAKAEARAAGFISDRKSLAEVRAALINDAAAEADGRPTDSTRPNAGYQAPTQQANAGWESAFAQLKTIRGM